MFRQPLWDVSPIDSHPLGDFQAKSIPILDLYELAAGKLAALLSCCQARDLFDTHQILQMSNIERGRLRTVFVVYGAMNRKDWRTVSVDDLDFNPVELVHHLLPTLHGNIIQIPSTPVEYGERLVQECRQALSAVCCSGTLNEISLSCARQRGDQPVAAGGRYWALRAHPKATAFGVEGN